MATELVARTSQLRFMPLNAQRAQQRCTGIAGEVLQFAAGSGTARGIRQISDRRLRGSHAKPLIEGSEFAQERLEGRLTQPSFLRARRILERLQAIQNQQGSTIRDKLRESLALLPGRSEPWI